MSTTLIFAELLIIGVQVAQWLFILVLDVFGYTWLQKFELQAFADWQVPIVVILLSSIYVLGILFDRVADAFFLKTDVRIKNKLLPNYSTPIGVMRFEVSKDNEHLNNQFEYTRSRMRVARASSLNFGLTTLLVIVFIFTRLQGISNVEKWGYASFALIFGGLLTVAAVYAWYKLMVAYFTFVKANYDSYKLKDSSSLHQDKKKK